MDKNEDLGSGINIPDPQHCFQGSFGSLTLLGSTCSAQLSANFYRTHAGYTADRKTRRKRNMGCCLLLSVVSRPPPPLAHHSTCLRLCIGLEEQGRAPPHPSPLDSLAIDLDDGL
jgi:hypothetical protein